MIFKSNAIIRRYFVNGNTTHIFLLQAYFTFAPFKIKYNKWELCDSLIENHHKCVGQELPYIKGYGTLK